MAKSLLFIPDISGFTKFVQTTEVAHSQHVIAELLEVLIEANTEELQLAEVEGDALFFYREGELLSQEKLLAQIETMFTAFTGHLKLLEKNRICPCNACATAPKLELKIVAHCGDIEFLEVQGNRKPFGKQVIEAHRLLKNSVESDNYVLISKELSSDIELPIYYYSKVFRFKQGKDIYDQKEVEYIYSIIDNNNLNIGEYSTAKEVVLEDSPGIVLDRNFSIAAESLMEYITNLSYRHFWVKGVDKFEYNENEVTRLGSEHVCVINNKHLNFVAVKKKVKPGKYVYGEMTKSISVADTVYQFYTINPISDNSCNLKIELYWETRSFLKKLAMTFFAQRIFRKNTKNSLNLLDQLVEERRTVIA
ncbi:MAG: DUF2652 domain-containing protein [Eudoraea sp.]